jgi:hypothetical protein
VGAQEKAPKSDGQRALGQVASSAGTVLVCSGPKKGCRALKTGATVSAGARLLALPGLRGELDLDKGTMRLSLLGHLPEDGEGPVLESALTVQTARDVELNLQIERGRFLLANRRERGAVKLRVRFLKEALTIELTAPGSAVALELVNQWPPGTPFMLKPKGEHQPLSDGFLFVLKGPVKVRLEDGAERSGLRDGAVYHWNSERGMIGPLAIKELPAWTRAPGAPKDKSPRAAARLALRQRLATKDVATALTEGLRASEPAARALAVYGLAAVDDLPAVLRAVTHPKDRELRRAALTALRHWSGQEAEHEVRLYQALVKGGYKPVEAEVMIGLLHGFARPDLERRETYETLIDYLGNDRPAVRELAAWHLYRLVPKARSINYDALGPEGQRKVAQAAWRKLLRAGKLPPREAPPETKDEVRGVRDPNRTATSVVLSARVSRPGLHCWWVVVCYSG